MTTTVSLPQYTQTFEQVFTVEPLAGPAHPAFYLDRFPDALYHKSPETHLVRFLYSLLGPAGVGWLRKQTLQARLTFEAQGLDLFDWDDFYGDPLSFGRILEEQWTNDVSGMLTPDEWDSILSKDMQYRSRALDFINGARAGNTPFGMELVARSGLGQNVNVKENYKYLFDIHSDDPVGLLHIGRTMVTNEMVVIPHYDIPRAEMQQLTIVGTPTSGGFVLHFGGDSTDVIPYNADQFDLASALEALPSIGPDGVEVTGASPSWTIRFTGPLDRINVPLLTVDVSFAGDDLANVIIQLVQNGVTPPSGSIEVSARAAHNMQTAVDRVKPMTTIPTLANGQLVRKLTDWIQAHASRELVQVQRYVTGTPAISWPSTDSSLWIEGGTENTAPRVEGDLHYNYVGFHNVHSISASSSHVGRFNQPQTQAPGFTYLAAIQDDTLEMSPDKALADYAEPLTVTTQTNDQQTHLLNGIYPTSYFELPDAPQLVYHDEYFWASQEEASGDEFLEIDLGAVASINFIAFEISRKPITVSIEVDTLNLGSTRRYTQVTPSNPFSSNVEYDATPNPWYYAEFHFTDRLKQIPFSQWIRLNFSRRDGLFLFDEFTQTQNPWSIEVRNLRIGRSVTNF